MSRHTFDTLNGALGATAFINIGLVLVHFFVVGLNDSQASVLITAVTLFLTAAIFILIAVLAMAVKHVR